MNDWKFYYVSDQKVSWIKHYPKGTIATVSASRQEYDYPEWGVRWKWDVTDENDKIIGSGASFNFQKAKDAADAVAA